MIFCNQAVDLVTKLGVSTPPNPPETCFKYSFAIDDVFHDKSNVLIFTLPHTSMKVM